jgi:hypothetical protein
MTSIKLGKIEQSSKDMLAVEANKLAVEMKAQATVPKYTLFRSG